MSCIDFTSTNPPCRTITIIEPDSTMLTNTSTGGSDQSLDETGSVILANGQTHADVIFVTTKAGQDYCFEYLYIDAFGMVNPGDVAPVPTIQTIFGFTATFAGAPVLEGYILRWRVVVISFGSTGILDQPETFYRQLPQSNLVVITLINPRSDTDYSFDELRVENLTDDPSIQSPIAIQVVAKTQTSFTIALSPTPPTGNYYLSGRVPSV